MRALSLLSIVVLLGCGSTEAPASTTTPPSPPPTASPSAPADFAITVTGGPVAGWMGAGMTFTDVQLRPGASAGSFELIETQSTADEMGMRGDPVETRRAAVTAERVSELHRYVEAHRAELEAPCFDPSIMDGAGSSYAVTYDGTTHNFSCVNASTPAFAGLGELYSALVSELLPPVVRCTTDADCRVETVDDCQCIPAYTADPPGPGGSHPCFVDPCMNYAPACDATTHACVLSPVSAMIGEPVAGS